MARTTSVESSKEDTINCRTHYTFPETRKSFFSKSLKKTIELEMMPGISATNSVVLKKQASDGEIWFAIRTVLSVYSMEVEKLLLLEEKEQMKQMLENVTSGRGEERIFLDGLIVGNVRENKAG